MQIENLTAIVTGGASGMGKATAKLLLESGAKVVLLDINEAQLKQTAEELCGVHIIVCDVSDAKSVEDAIATVNEKIGAARICINCAGIVHARRMINKDGPMALDEYMRVININLIGTFNVMRIAAYAMTTLPELGDTKERGVIINTASIAAFEGQIGQAAYSASKSAIVGMTLPVARELASFGIRVMTIAPGLVDTPMFAKITSEVRASLEALVPFPQRLATPHEYAMLAKHIIENPMLNGEVIRLDGAIRMQPK